MNRPLYGERDYTFGQRILTLRTHIGLTQAGLAELLHVSRRAVVEWEAGSNYPTAEHLKALIELGVRTSAFPAGQQAEEIRALWQAAQQKLLLDEVWLAALLGQPRPLLTLLPPLSSEPLQIHQRGEMSAPKPTPEQRVDWGEALAVSNFYGREQELVTLTRWVLEEGCRMVSVLGMGGIGKSTLVVRAMQQLASHFDVVLFRSLRDAPECSTLLDACLQVLVPQSQAMLSQGLQPRMTLLLSELRSQRVLLVLDNLETLLSEGDMLGRLRPDLEAYADLLRMFAEAEHQSCLLLTSREQPAVLRALEGRYRPVRSLRLLGLDAAACTQLLAEHGVDDPPEEAAQLGQLYAGNPLALGIVAETIFDLFGGQISPFFSANTIVFGSISGLLDEQWKRLSPLEQTLLFWLAILREPATLKDLQAVLLALPVPKQLLEAVDGLRRRSLLERGQQAGTFTLQSVVLEFVTSRLVSIASEEIRQGRLSLLRELGLEQAQAREYVRQTQERLLVTPLLERLKSAGYSSAEVEKRLLELLSTLRTLDALAQGYAPANLITLLRLLRGDLRGLDLSRLSIRGAYLQGVEMQDTCLAGAILRDVAWTSAFDAIQSLAVSPDGRYIAAGSNNGQVRVWREEGRVAHLTFQAHPDRVNAMAFSPNGQALVTAGWEGSIRLWDVERGAILWTTEDQRMPVISLAINSSGKLASGSYDGDIHIWDLRTGRHLARLHKQGGRILTLTWSPDGYLLASGGPDSIIQLWAGEQWTLQRELPGHRDLVCALAFAPGPKTSLLASGSYDQTIKLWDAQTGTCIRTLEGHTNLVAMLAWSSDGRTLASASHDMTIRLWDAQTGQCRHILRGHTDAVTNVAFLPTGERLLSGCGHRTLRLWDVQSGQNVRTMQGYALALNTLAWSPDGRLLVSGSSEASLTLWNMATRRPAQVLRGHRIQVYTVAWSRTGNRIASGSEDHTVRLWDAQTGVCTRILHGHTANVSSLDWSVDGRWLASGSYDGSIRIWDMQGGASRVGIEQVGVVSAVVWSPDGTLLACATEEGLVLVWRADDGAVLQRFEHSGVVGALCWSPDGEHLVSGTVDGETGVLSIWNLQQGALVRRLEGHRGFIWGIEWSPHEDLLLSAGADGTVRWWDPKQGVNLATVQAHQGWARAVRISPDGQTVASCGQDGVIRLWDLHSHQHLATLRTERPYERLDISHTIGLTQAQLASLQALGAMGAEYATPQL